MIPLEIFAQVGQPVSADSPMNFRCQQCGDCCRNHALAPIVLTGYDMYRLAGVLGMRSTMELIENEFVQIVVDSYGLPVCVLSATPDGSCCFLDEGRCAVHENRPAVCALYPLGRIYDATVDGFVYVKPHGNMCRGTEAGAVQSVQRWLADMRVAEDEEFHAAYERHYVEAATAYITVTNQHYSERVYYRMIWAFFGGFDTKKLFLPQLEENVRGLRPLLKKAFRKSH